MTEPADSDLFPTPDPVEAERQRDVTTGLLPSQMLREAVALGREILSPLPIGNDQIQPASLDLRLGEVAYRVRASFLPGGRARVRDKLDLLSMHRIDLSGGAVLEKDCVYIVPLCEYVALRHRTSAFANPKSSIGRLDVFARVITDHGTEFDRIRESYKGPLYAEISPRSFSILVRAGVQRHRTSAAARGGWPGLGAAGNTSGARGDPRRPRLHRRRRRRCGKWRRWLQGAPSYRSDRCRPGRPLRAARFLGAGLRPSRAGRPGRDRAGPARFLHSRLARGGRRPARPRRRDAALPHLRRRVPGSLRRLLRSGLRHVGDRRCRQPRRPRSALARGAVSDRGRSGVGPPRL